MHPVIGHVAGLPVEELLLPLIWGGGILVAARAVVARFRNDR
jgi:hypothetical protein